NSKSDIEVGAKCLETGIWGAFKNIEINLPNIEDEKFKSSVLKEGKDILDRAAVNAKEVCRILDKRR
ncbi:MAG: cyclodeaminase/cyclohydrolase family protein, partial [Ignavibacteria bacterium]